MIDLPSHFNVKEIFYTIQGEGAHAGRAAVFCRFAGCNGWSGLEKDRKKGPLPCSQWCDTDFVGGMRYHEDDLLAAILKLFPQSGYRMVVLTGGEPALQLTNGFLRELLKNVWMVAIETNGTKPLPEIAHDRCWITVSPKTEKVLQDKASELKLIYPTIAPEKFDYIGAMWRYLQPLDGPNRAANTEATVEYIKAHPQWRLSIQTHKFAGFP